MPTPRSSRSGFTEVHGWSRAAPPDALDRAAVWDRVARACPRSELGSGWTGGRACIGHSLEVEAVGRPDFAVNNGGARWVLSGRWQARRRAAPVRRYPVDDRRLVGTDVTRRI